MPVHKKKKKRGAVSNSGKVALRFKKGSSQDTSINSKMVRTGRLKDKKKVIPGHLGTRQSGETVAEFKLRRDKFRASRR